MELIDQIEDFLKKYSEIIAIVLFILGLLGAFCKYIISSRKKLNVEYTIGSNTRNPNNCFKQIRLINHTSKTFTASSLSVVLFDNKNKYTLTLCKEPFKLDTGDVKIIDITPVSYYMLSGAFVDISNLVHRRQMYFLLNPLKKKFF